jgi:hypothetical protein
MVEQIPQLRFGLATKRNAIFLLPTSSPREASFLSSRRAFSCAGAFLFLAVWLLSQIHRVFFFS